MFRIASWVLCLVAVQQTTICAAEKIRPAPDAELAVVLHDGSILKGVSLPESVELLTKFGKLIVPVKDIRRLEVGKKETKQAEFPITITTADCVLVGTMNRDVLKVRTRALGEVQLKLTEVCSIQRAVEACLGTPVRPSGRSARQPTIDDIITEALGGVSDEVIIKQIRETGCVFALTSTDIQRLAGAGVSQSVINEMLQSSTRETPAAKQGQH
jgi:hypothetical protein